MFTVSRRGNGYHVSVGDHRPTTVVNLGEVWQCLVHYYDALHGGKAEAFAPLCPFCRQIVGRKATKERTA
jgi:hypothetical protein